jgi:hypothetical protein
MIKSGASLPAVSARRQAHCGPSDRRPVQQTPLVFEQQHDIPSRLACYSAMRNVMYRPYQPAEGGESSSEPISRDTPMLMKLPAGQRTQRTAVSDGRVILTTWPRVRP